MKISALTLLLLIEPFGFAFANTPKKAVPVFAARASILWGDVTPANKTFEMAKKKSSAPTGTKRPRQPRKSSTKT
jgi:hypothetical protein